MELSQITSPEDVKSLSSEELKALAKEIRKRIINVLAVNGGHLASNLGIVELTLALHYVFNSPSDKLIWDVSHQTYVHKLLTGRNHRFETIRKFEGLCGFSDPRESPYDHFHAGHAGTALSLALGVATRRDLQEEDFVIVPVIGDATLTCGLSLEALNNIKRDLKKMVIILNDNRMSISKNVGAITHILSRMVNNPTLHKWHAEVDAWLEKIPFGKWLAGQGHKVASSIKNLFSPAAYFEQFGISYIGPISGHDVDLLIQTLEGVKNSSSPVIVHVMTNKGEGLEEAIKSPVTHHGAKPFNPETGKFLPSPSANPTFPKVFGQEMCSMAAQDPDLVAVTPAMSFGSCLDAMMEKFPDRCLDVGIAEGHAVTFCGGIAYEQKKRVVCSIYSTFLQRAFDNLFHDVCLQEIPVVFAIDRGGIATGDGATHQGIYDISFLNAMPSMVIAQPRDGRLLRELLHSAFEYGKPTAIRYPNMETEDAPPSEKKRPLGKGEVLAEGEKLLLIGLGHMSKVALEIREKLKKHGIVATVVDPIFVKPLDADLLDRLLVNHDCIVTIEEHAVTCGLGAIVNHLLLSQGYAHVQVLNLGIPDVFVHHGGYKDVMKSIGLTADQMTVKISEHFSTMFKEVAS